MAWMEEYWRLIPGYAAFIDSSQEVDGELVACGLRLRTMNEFFFFLTWWEFQSKKKKKSNGKCKKKTGCKTDVYCAGCKHMLCQTTCSRPENCIPLRWLNWIEVGHCRLFLYFITPVRSFECTLWNKCCTSSICPSFGRLCSSRTFYAIQFMVSP